MPHKCLDLTLMVSLPGDKLEAGKKIDQAISGIRRVLLDLGMEPALLRPFAVRPPTREEAIALNHPKVHLEGQGRPTRGPFAKDPRYQYCKTWGTCGSPAAYTTNDLEKITCKLCLEIIDKAWPATIPVPMEPLWIVARHFDDKKTPEEIDKEAGLPPGTALRVIQGVAKAAAPDVQDDPCDCWEGCNDREGKPPCQHYRLVEGAGPFYNTSEPGICRCGADGPPWHHRAGCTHD